MEPSPERFSEIEFEQLLAAASRAKQGRQGSPLLVPMDDAEFPGDEPRPDVPPKQPS
jgi:hypothetical protein